MKFPVRLLFIPLFLILCSLFFLKPVSAQTISPEILRSAQDDNTNANSYMQPNTNPDVPKNIHTYTQNALIEIMSAVVCQLSGIDPVNPSQECLGADPKTGKIGFVKDGGGAIGMVSNMIAMTFTPPLHASDYFDHLANNFGIGEKAYAANTGSGFNGLKPLLPIWEAFRNIVYLLFVLIFIIVGLVIMLRIKIDPRTVMTIENQIPKIIIALLLVTFSYPLAGFLIDFMWLSIYLVIAVIGSISIHGTPMSQMIVTHFHNFQNLNALDVANNLPANKPGGMTGIVGISTNMAGSAGGIIAGLFDGPIGKFLGGIVSGLFTYTFLTFGSKIGFLEGIFKSIPGVGGIIGNAIYGAAMIVGTTVFGNQILGFIGSIVTFLIVAIAILWAMLRLWFQLITAYIFILLDVVLAPFLLLFGIFPGGSLFFGWWTRDMIANLSVFPVTITMFLLGSVFMQAFGSGKTPDQFVPPLIGNTGSTNTIGSIIGLGVILMTPLVVQIMKDTLKAPQFKYTAGIGQALGVAPGIIGGSWNALSSPYGALMSFRSFKSNVFGQQGLVAGIGERARRQFFPPPQSGKEQ